MLGLALAPATQAHHSAAAAYDAVQTIRLVGTVAEFAWKNPHCHVYVDVTAGAFAGQRYAVELGSPEAMAESGWTKTLLHPGDAVVMRVHPSRTGTAAGLCRDCPLTINGQRWPPHIAPSRGFRR
jgi:hypothetical protein